MLHSQLPLVHGMKKRPSRVPPLIHCAPNAIGIPERRGASPKNEAPKASSYVTGTWKRGRFDDSPRLRMGFRQRIAILAVRDGVRKKAFRKPRQLLRAAENGGSDSPNADATRTCGALRDGQGRLIGFANTNKSALEVEELASAPFQPTFL